MENEFIPYEEALALKKLGFNEPCCQAYRTTGENELSEFYSNPSVVEEWLKRAPFIKAPLWQQAFYWLQNKLEVDISITMWQDGSGNLNELHHDEDIFTFENKLECLKQLLTLIKNK